MNLSKVADELEKRIPFQSGTDPAHLLMDTALSKVFGATAEALRQGVLTEEQVVASILADQITSGVCEQLEGLSKDDLKKAVSNPESFDPLGIILK